jgi:acyl transferase domain-containing protein
MTGTPRADTDIAIVGLAGRFPGAGDVGEFWANLRGGVESVVGLSEQELLAAGVPREVFEQDRYVRRWPRFEGMDLFDAEFFGYSVREAALMDPQHRLFLEASWASLEDAGYDPARCKGLVGVFAGAGTNGYLHHVHSHPDVVETMGATQVHLGNELGFLATRVSYKLDLKGPSISLRTACSTALVAVHTAIRSLRARECDMALAGAARIDPESGAGYVYREGSFLSPDGHCRPFDGAARGTVFGSGVGVVVLKRLADAVADGDTVRAVIKGSAVNNDGAMKVGFTAPSLAGQAEVIAAALDDAGLRPSEIDYVEAHGTGTPLGDPVEVAALGRVFGGCERVWLGSLKSNVGHLDAASGVAGLVKTVLSLEHELLPATLHFVRGNPDIDFVGGPFRVVSRVVSWPRSGRVRRAGVSAFGFGGTNAHVVVEEAPVRLVSSVSRRDGQLVVISARSVVALEQVSDRLAGFLRRERPVLADVAYTLACGRRMFPFRRVVRGSDGESVAAALQSGDPGVVVSGQVAGEPAGVVFMFSGQGSQFPGMVGDLYAVEVVFREAVDECANVLAEVLDGDLRQVLSGAGDDDRLSQTRWVQPALFVVEYALVQLWRSWGVAPTALLGHSLGELVAACVSGVFALADALRLVVLRGELMQQCAPGVMVAVTAQAQAIAEVLPVGVSLAAVNGPQDCVVSGAVADVDRFIVLARQYGWVTRPVAVESGFHSVLMEPAAASFEAAVAAVTRAAPTIPFVSNVTGDWISDADATDPAYWGRHMRECVQFAAGVRRVVSRSAMVLLEIGPGRTLAGYAGRVLAEHPHSATILTCLPHRHDHRSAGHALQNALGRLWLTGLTPDWDTYYHHEQRHRIPLPTYPFQRQRHWLTKHTPTTTPKPAVPQPRPDVADWFSTPSWRSAPLAVSAEPDVTQHWLIFVDADGVGAAIDGRLRSIGARVSTVSVGTAWSRAGDGRYVMDPANGADYVRALETIDGDVPTRIVHCWGLFPLSAVDSGGTPRLDGFESLLLLGKALGQAPAAPRSLWVIADGLHDLTGAEPLAPSKATVLGPCRVLPREIPGLRCRVVDIEDGPDADDRRVGMVLSELAATLDLPTETIAIRGRHRWVLGFSPLRLPVPQSLPACLRPGGVYLITGGTGALALELAEHLAEVDARIVLTTRASLPPEQDWAQWLTSDERPAGLVLAVNRIAALRGKGAQVLVAHADVSDAAAMRAAVLQAVRRWGRVDGAFHLAGVPGGGLVHRKELADAAATMRPKVAGTLALEAALSDQKLDFLLLFGSNAANIGNLGQIDYAAANSFLDAFAQDRSRRYRTVAVDWGPWKDVGMAAAAASNRPGDSRMLDAVRRGMSVRDGLRALDAVLASDGVPQVVVSPTPLPQLFELAGAANDLRATSAGQAGGIGGQASSRSVRPPGAADPDPGETARTLCGLWQELLGVDRVDAHDNFFDLGGDSLLAIQLMSLTNEQLGTDFAIADLYEGATVAHLVECLSRQPTKAEPARRDERRDRMHKRHLNQRRRRAVREDDGRTTG